MSSQERPPQENSGTYFVQDRSNQEEMERLHLQDEIVTTAMGGVLPEQGHPEQLRRVLDVGCGTGGWLIETAQAYPQIELLIGVDISQTMIDFARAKAQEAGMADRVEFQVGDALRMLEFPPSFFDLVNQRASTSYLRTWDWPKLLLEYRRVVQPEGIVRITEPAVTTVMPNSPALTRWYLLFLQTLHMAGNYFELDADSILNHLVPLLNQHRLQNIQTRSHIMEFYAGTPQGKLFAEVCRHMLKTVDPFLRKWLKLPDDYEEIRQQAFEELQQPDFVAQWKWLTAWADPGDSPVFTSRRC